MKIVEITPNNHALTSEKPAPQQKDINTLSKKERKALREKELADLDGLLAEFLPVGTACGQQQITESNIVNEPTKSNTAETIANTSSSKKTNKKKKKSNNVSGEVDTNTQTESAKTDTVDITSVLKERAKKSSKKKNENIAVVEALKAVTVDNSSSSRKDKKKKDKKNYNEMPY